MKDRIISFMLFLIITAIILAFAIFGYVVYKQVIKSEQLILNFEGIASILDSKKKDEAIDTNIDIFNGIEGGANSEELILTTNKVYRYLYEQLDDTAKTIYNKLYDNKENLKTGTYKVDFGNAFQSTLIKDNGEQQLKKEYQSAIETLIYENPEMFYLDATSMFLNIEKTTKITGTKYNVYINNGDKSNYLANGLNSKEEVDAYQAKIDKVKEYVVENVVEKSDYEKIKLIHNYLIDTIEYDSTISKNNIYDIYGALVLRESVCEGYAKAFQYLMDSVGIENVIVIGRATNSSGKTENHAWNYVKLDEIWYAVDTTWDDPILIGDGILTEKSKYRYFLKGANTMNKNHFASGKFTDEGQVFTYPELNFEDYE